MSESRIAACIIGTAVGDALGLPYEGLSRRRAKKLLGSPTRHRFLLGRGMVSDDTEHTCFVAQSLIASGRQQDEFAVQLARRLKWWFTSLPAGIGRATIRSCLKLWLGWSPQNSGVFSAGNGPAMRSAILGATFHDVDDMVEFVRISARITHSDPKAEFGAIAVALAAFATRRTDTINGELFVNELEEIIGPEGRKLTRLLRRVVDSVNASESTLDFAANNGWERGISGYTYHTVPIAIHAWLSHPYDYRAAVTSVIECGGDADTTAAIVGGIVATATGIQGIPVEWVSTLRDWPLSAPWMMRLADQLEALGDNGTPGKPLQLNFFCVLARNLFFLLIVLTHGFRRLLPPY